MAIGQMRQAIFTDANLALFQQSINDQFSQVGKVLFMDGTLLEEDLITGQANVINTKLARRANGYFVVSNSANSTIWNDAFAGDISITLRCSANTTVTLWIF